MSYSRGSGASSRTSTCRRKAPNAQPVCSPIGAATNFADFSIRDPMPVDEEQELDLAQHRLGFLITTYIHTWDSMLPYEKTTLTQFCSDVFIQPGTGPATTDQALIEEMVASYKMVGIFPSQPHLDSALGMIEAQVPKVLACHHRSMVTSQIPAYIKALREGNVVGMTEWKPMQEAKY